MRRVLLLASLLVTLSSSLAACGGGQMGKVDYSVSAQQNYERGLKKMEREDWVGAAKYFTFIKARFPYSKYAVLAELRLADAEFGAEHYLQAVDLFKAFIKFHPSHEMVRNGYASFRVAGAYYLMLSDDWWLLPPAFEKDQSATSDAHRELTEFLRKYPDSPQLPKVKVLLAKINKRLAEHELYAARFYWDREKPMGTVLRLRRLLEKHGGTRHDAEALYLLGKAYLEVDEPARARKAWERLVKEHPTDDHADEVREELTKLPG